MEPEATISLGMESVGVNINPSKLPVVDQIKMHAAALIDLIDKLPFIPEPEEIADAHVSRINHERARLKFIAMSIQEAEIWAVKAATKGIS